jgi:hypothetical protein
VGDMGEIFNAMREHKRDAKATRVETQAPFVEWLKGVSVTWLVLPGGYRFNVANAAGHHHTFDYWPSSGKWTRTGTNKILVGEKKLRAAIVAIVGLPA